MKVQIKIVLFIPDEVPCFEKFIDSISQVIRIYFLGRYDRSKILEISHIKD